MAYRGKSGFPSEVLLTPAVPAYLAREDAAHMASNSVGLALKSGRGRLVLAATVLGSGMTQLDGTVSTSLFRGSDKTLRRASPVFSGR